MSKKTSIDGVLENFNAIKNNYSEYTKAKKENFEFDNNVDTDFADPANGERFVLDVKEGTLAGAVRQYSGIRGQQDLNLIEIVPSWKYDGQDAITAAGVGNLDANKAGGDVNLDKETINIGQEYFQVKLNPLHLDNSIYGLETGSSYDPNLAAASYIMESAVKEMKYRVGLRFFSGFGATNPTNGFLDIAFTQQGTAAAITETTILARLKELGDAIASSTHANRTDNVILLSPTHFQYYINALVDGKYGDYINQATLAGRNETLSSIPFIYNPNIMVMSDSLFTNTGQDGAPKVFQLDNVVFGTTSLTENEMPDLWYSKDNHAYYVRGFVYGGVQKLDNSSFFDSDVA